MPRNCMPQSNQLWYEVTSKRLRRIWKHLLNGLVETYEQLDDEEPLAAQDFRVIAQELRFLANRAEMLADTLEQSFGADALFAMESVYDEDETGEMEVRAS